MAREFAISIYLVCFRSLFNLFSLNTTKKKTTFIASFGSNIAATMDALEERMPHMEIIVLQAPGCKINLSATKRTVLIMQPKHLPDFIRSIYHIATSSHVFIDNYYGFLASCHFKPDVRCIQLWHAAGAIKHFGLQDLSNKQRSTKAVRRFHTVYDRFSFVVVGSDQMKDVFKESFALGEDRFLRTGVPRTDFFFNKRKMKAAEQRLLEYFPIIKDKKMLLYAPTYRDGALDETELHMDMKKMYEQFKYEYVLFLRLHPAVEGEFANKYPGFIYNVSNYPHINDLLVGSDILITDYSSIPFEYSLLGKPMIFYAYDYEAYALNRGVWSDYTDHVPGPVVHNTEQLIKVIRKGDFSTEKVPLFANTWNEFSTGDSALKLIDALYETENQSNKSREHTNV